MDKTNLNSKKAERCGTPPRSSQAGIPLLQRSRMNVWIVRGHGDMDEALIQSVRKNFSTVYHTCCSVLGTYIHFVQIHLMLSHCWLNAQRFSVGPF